MENINSCACKGIRTCLICENKNNILKPDIGANLKKYPSYVYCPYCNRAWPGWDMNLYKQHPNHLGNFIEFPDTCIKLNFINHVEQKILIGDLDSLPWEISQSGRRKQNYGPKTNFKKKRLKIGSFNGFPKTTKFVQEKFKQIQELKNFQTIEQCTLEYDPQRGASIDPHIDDCWIWGERIVTVNVLGETVLTMKPYRDSFNRYNLNCIEDFKNEKIPEQDIVVRLPMPQGSLIILYGSARYKWEHAILREDINSRRVCLAYRELTPPYLPDDKGNCNEESFKILQKAMHFW